MAYANSDSYPDIVAEKRQQWLDLQSSHDTIERDLLALVDLPGLPGFLHHYAREQFTINARILEAICGVSFAQQVRGGGVGDWVPRGPEEEVSYFGSLSLAVKWSVAAEVLEGLCEWPPSTVNNQWAIRYFMGAWRSVPTQAAVLARLSTSPATQHRAGLALAGAVAARLTTDGGVGSRLRNALRNLDNSPNHDATLRQVLPAVVYQALADLDAAEQGWTLNDLKRRVSILLESDGIPAREQALSSDTSAAITAEEEAFRLREESLLAQIDANDLIEHAALSDREREAVDLRRHELEYHEIAEQMGLATSTVGVLISRARRKLAAARKAS